MPHQALDLTDAFRAYTRGGARANRQHTGTVQVGVPADLVLLDRDPFTAPLARILGARVRATWIHGLRRH